MCQSENEALWAIMKWNMTMAERETNELKKVPKHFLAKEGKLRHNWSVSPPDYFFSFPAVIMKQKMEK